MRILIAVMLMLCLTTPVTANDIKDYVEFENAKLVTYSDATASHLKTHKPVIVWVGMEDFNAWSLTKDLGIHCFSKDFPGLSLGIVVGGERNGEYVRLADIKIPYNETNQPELIAQKIREALSPPRPRTENPNAAAVIAAPLFGFRSCANGQCGQ